MQHLYRVSSNILAAIYRKFTTFKYKTPVSFVPSTYPASLTLLSTCKAALMTIAKRQAYCTIAPGNIKEIDAPPEERRSTQTSGDYSQVLSSYTNR
jgi:hypothetical protein